MGFDVNRLEAMLYSPIRYPQGADSAGDPLPISNRATRELTMVVANTAAPMPHWGRGATADLIGGRLHPT